MPASGGPSPRGQDWEERTWIGGQTPPPPEPGGPAGGDGRGRGRGRRPGRAAEAGAAVEQDGPPARDRRIGRTACTYMVRSRTKVRYLMLFYVWLE